MTSSKTNNMAQQTAVDFVEYQLFKYFKLYQSQWEEFNEVLKEAKEIEKEQKIEFAKHCLDRALDLDIRTAFFNVEEYYNETYQNK